MNATTVRDSSCALFAGMRFPAKASPALPAQQEIRYDYELLRSLAAISRGVPNEPAPDLVTFPDASTVLPPAPVEHWPDAASRYREAQRVKPSFDVYA